jgi:hypothetical protein
MSKLSKVLLAIGLVAAVVLVGGLLGWLGSRGGSATAVIPPEPVPEQKASPTPSPATKTGAAPSPEPQAPDLNAGQPPAANLITNWEEKIDAILTAEGESADKAKQMFELFPRLPDDGKEEVSRHLSNLVPDTDYSELAKLLADTHQPAGVQEVLFGDTLNRPNSLKLPALLSVAREPQHVKAGDAKEILALFLDADHGSDWDKWQATVDEWLKNNPD